MTTVPIVLLCAPSGTGLSRIARELTHDDHPTATQDLESRLCDSYVGHHSHIELGLQRDEVPSMWHIVRRPRDELYLAWKNCFRESIKSLAGSASAPYRLLCMHISWYNPDTTEFFSPVSVVYIRRATKKQKCTVKQVVILIDDIYDMYHRLQGPNDIYRSDAINFRSERLHDLHYPTPNATSRKRARLDAVESALAHLISWRQHEILHTENIARELGAAFTVLGIKHSKAAASYLLQNEETPKIYLSHRISEVRRINKKTSALPRDLGDWSAVVDEVNDLHSAFADRQQLLINPTAIDELRFGDSKGKPKQRPLLARRWKIIEPFDYLLWEPPTQGYEHTQLLKGELELPDATATAVARSLSNRIYFDISFRDHVIVEHTSRLCVYRPFFSGSNSDQENSTNVAVGVDWSGGVRPEVMHWYRKTLFQTNQRRRIAFVHTRREIRERIAWLKFGDQRRLAETILNHFPDIYHHHDGCREDATQLCGEARRVLNSREPGTHLSQDPAHEQVQLSDSISRNLDRVVRSLEVAYQLATFHFFTLLTRPEEAEIPGCSAVPAFDVCMILGRESESEDRLLMNFDEVANKLCQFYGGEFDRRCSRCDPLLHEDDLSDSLERLCLGCEESEIWRIHSQEFIDVMSVDVVEFCCRILAISYEYLRERSSYLQEALAP